MKKLEELLTSFEISKKLKEAGMPQKSNFKWKYWEAGGTECGIEIVKNDGVFLDQSACFLVGELMEWIDGEILEEYFDYKMIGKNEFEFMIEILNSPDKLSEVLLWAIEKGLVEFKESKQ